MELTKQSIDEEREMRRQLLANVADLQADLSQAAERSKERLKAQQQIELQQRKSKIQSVRANISKILSTDANIDRDPSNSPSPTPLELRERALNMITNKGGLPKRVPSKGVSTRRPDFMQSSGIELYSVGSKLVFKDDSSDELLNDSLEVPVPANVVPSPHPADHTNDMAGIESRRMQVQYRQRHHDDGRGMFTYSDGCLTPEGFSPHVPSPAPSQTGSKSPSNNSLDCQPRFANPRRSSSHSPFSASTVGHSASPVGGAFSSRSRSPTPTDFYSPLQSARNRSPASEISASQDRTELIENPLADLDDRRRIRHSSLDKYSPMRGRSPPPEAAPTRAPVVRKPRSISQPSQQPTASLIKRGYVTNPKTKKVTPPPKKSYKTVDKEVARQRVLRAAKALREQQLAPQKRRQLRTDQLLQRTRHRIDDFCTTKGIVDRAAAVEAITEERMREQISNKKKREIANKLREQWLQKAKERQREEYLESLNAKQESRKRTSSVQSKPPLPGFQTRRSASAQRPLRPVGFGSCWEAPSPGEFRSDASNASRQTFAFEPNVSGASSASERIVTVNLFDSSLMSEPASPGD
eukprot:TRINITY_DN20913_c0_g1_i1.p1 TRINITY_DN20913_c0_g1~~TRINITY_DN20913_c0_g1_i1.p1  ORF type:complete len:590 (+),score=134.11 TRINITY_DN20913_c0_g1_i1:25-1770(+)